MKKRDIVRKAQTKPMPEAAPAVPTQRQGRVALACIIILASIANGWGLWQHGHTDPYFATAVQSMLTSWHNFFFVAFDPAGFISVDKPPLGLWLQAALARLLGFSDLSLVLPQALAGVLSVALLYHLVQRPYGEIAGLGAALALAITPICVATNRSNATDSLVMLSALAGAWGVRVAAERGKLRPLLLCALALGLGFNVKVLQPLP